MFDDVLIPLDGSPHAEAIFPVLNRVVGSPAKIELLHAVAVDMVTVVDLPGLGGINFEGMLSAMLDAGKDYLEGQAAPLRKAGSEVRCTTVADGPEHAILEATGTHDLIAMASHGRSGASRWLLGSVTERVLRVATRPVLVVHPTEDSARDLSRVMVAVDGSHRIDVVIPLAARLAKERGAQIELVACVERGDASWEERADRYLAETAEALPEGSTSSTIRKGPTVDQLVAHAKDREVGLILMATHGRTGLSRFVMGSITEQVLRHTGVPMLLPPVPAE